MVGWTKIRLLSRGGGSPPYRALLFVKAHIKTTFAHILPEPEASLLTGILLGVESGIPERVKDAFSTSGTMHVVAVSGFNYKQDHRSGLGSEWLFDMSTNELRRGNGGSGLGVDRGVSTCAEVSKGWPLCMRVLAFCSASAGGSHRFSTSGHPDALDACYVASW